MTYSRLEHIANDSLAEPFAGALELLSESLNAQTVAIFLLETDSSNLELVALKTQRKDFLKSARRSLADNLLSGVAQNGLTVSEVIKSDVYSRLGLYSSGSPEIVYIAIPFGNNGVLWVDREGAERFAPDQIKLATWVANIVNDIIILQFQSRRTKDSGRDLDIITSLADGMESAIQASDINIDSIVSKMTEAPQCDGALVAISTDKGELCRIASVSGFSGALARGKVVRLRQGWARWAIDKMRPAIISGLKGDEKSLPIFHTGEAIGFPVKSVAVIPWYGYDKVDGVLIAASKTASADWESRKSVWMFLAALVGVIRRLEISGKILKSVRRYDGESGVMSEGFFRNQLQIAFDRQVTSSGTFFVLMAKIVNVDKLYMEYNYKTMNRFLGLFCEKLSMSTKRQCIAGKYGTGCFCIGIENLPATEVDTLVRKAAALLGQGISNVDGVDIRHEVEFGWALFPHDSQNLSGLLTRASIKLRHKKSLNQF